MVKIIFFDVDGTLKSFSNTGLTKPVICALKSLKEKGIKIFIATGRAPYTVPEFPEVAFDGYLCFNGAYCFDEKQVIFSHPLEKDEVQQFLQNAQRLKEPVILAGKTELKVSGYSKILETYMSFAGLSYPAIDPGDFNRFTKEDVYQLMAGGNTKKEAGFLRNCRRLKIARWWDQAFDVVADNCSKSMAMRKVLKTYGFTRQESMAFGDGGNDQDMIEYAGIGVAMGNAADSVKAVADYITDDVNEDGVVTALNHFGLLP